MSSQSPGPEQDTEHNPGASAPVSLSAEAFLDLADKHHAAFLDDPEASPAALAWIALNHWRSFRDRLGFRGFEQLNRALVERIRSGLQAGDHVARFGASGVVVLLDPVDGRRDYAAWAKSVLDNLSREILTLDGRPLAASVSIGLCRFDRHLRQAEETLLDAAQTAERLAREGKNQFEIHQPSISASQISGNEHLLIELLRESLRENRIRIMFQPLLEVGEQESSYFQLWARLVSPEGEMIPASEFLEVAQRNRILGKLERWVLAYAIRFLTGRRDRLGGLGLFVNQLPELMSEQMMQWFAERLGRLPEVARALILEFQLDDLYRAEQPAEQTLARLRKLGMRVSIAGLDETVFSDPGVLRLPADFLRMGGSFPARFSEDADLAENFEEFIRQAHQAGRRIIMPNVEDESIMIRLWKLDVDLVQGDMIQPARESLELARSLS